MILQTGDTSLVPIEGPHKLTGAGGPHLDGPVPAGRHDVLLIKINYIHSRSEIVKVKTWPTKVDSKFGFPEASLYITH